MLRIGNNVMIFVLIMMNVEDGYKCKGGMSTNVDKGCSSRMDTNVKEGCLRMLIKVVVQGWIQMLCLLLLAGLYSQVVKKKL